MLLTKGGQFGSKAAHTAWTAPGQDGVFGRQGCYPASISRRSEPQPDSHTHLPTDGQLPPHAIRHGLASFQASGFGKAHFLAWHGGRGCGVKVAFYPVAFAFDACTEARALPSWRLLPLAPWCLSPLCQSLLRPLLQTVPTYASFLCKFRIQNQTARLLPF